MAIRFWQAVRKWAEVHFPSLLRTLNPGLPPHVRSPVNTRLSCVMNPLTLLAKHIDIPPSPHMWKLGVRLT